MSQDAYTQRRREPAPCRRVGRGAGRAPLADRARAGLAGGPAPRPLRERPAHRRAHTGVAFGADGVGTKMVVAERMGRFETIGIDCIAMNVNDLDLRRRRADRAGRHDPLPLREPRGDRRDRRRPAPWRRAGGDRDPRRRDRPGRRRRHRLGAERQRDRAGRARRDRHGARIAPGDAIIGLPSSGLHSNGYTLARRALAGLPLDEDPGGLGRRSARSCSSRPRSTCWPILELLGLAERRRPRPRPHHRRRAQQPAPARPQRRLRDRRSAPRAAGLRPDRRARRGRRSRDARGLQHGLRLLRDRSRVRPRADRRRCSAAATPRRDGSARSPTAPASSSAPDRPTHAQGGVRRVCDPCAPRASIENTRVMNPPLRPLGMRER